MLIEGDLVWEELWMREAGLPGTPWKEWKEKKKAEGQEWWKSRPKGWSESEFLDWLKERGFNVRKG